MSNLAHQLLSALNEIADFLPPEEELGVKKKWLDAVRSGGEPVAPEDLYGGSIKDYVSKGGRAGASDPYKVYSPHGSQNVYWSSHRGNVHSMQRSRAEELSSQMSKMQGTPDADPDSHYQAITPDILRPENTSDSETEMSAFHGDEMAQDPNIDPLTGKEWLPKQRMTPEELAELEVVTDKYRQGMIGTVDNPGIISNNGTVWGTGKKLIDNPEVPPEELLRTTNGMRPVSRGEWAGRSEADPMTRGKTLENHIASYESWMLRQGLSPTQMEEGFDHILEANKIIDKALADRNNFKLKDMDRLSELVTTDGSHVFYVVEGQYMTMHDQSQATALLERLAEPGLNFSEFKPTYDKDPSLISSDIQLSENIDEKEKEAYDNLVGTTYEYLSGAQALLESNPERARELIIGAAQNAQSAVNDIGDVMHMVTNGGTLDLGEAAKTLDEYSLFKFIEDMDSHPKGWSMGGQPMDITDVKDVLYGITYHLRNSLAAQSESGLLATDYTRTGDMKRNALEIQDGVFHYADIGTATEDGLNKFGMHSVEGTEIPVSTKAFGVFGDPSTKSGLHATRTGRQLNGGGFKMLNFIKADSAKDIDRMMDFTGKAFQRVTGRELSPGVIEDYKDTYLATKKYHEQVNLVLHDENAFDQIKKFMITKIEDSGMQPGAQKKKLAELEKLNFSTSKPTARGKVFHTDRVRLANTMLVDYFTALANGDLEELAPAKQKRFIGLTSLLLSNAEIGDSDVGYVINDNFKSKIHYTSQSKLMDGLIAGIINNPGRMVYAKGKGDSGGGQSVSIRRPKDFRRAALTTTFNKSSGLAVSSKWAIDYINSRIHTSYG